MSSAVAFLGIEAEGARCDIAPELFKHYFFSVTKWNVEGDSENWDWLVGGDCPFLSIEGDAADNVYEAVAIYAHELRHWCLNVGAGRSDSRVVYDIVSWKPVLHLTREYLEWFSTREGYLTWHFIPNFQHFILRQDIRAEYIRKGVIK